MGADPGGNGEWGIWRTSEDEVRAVRKIADEAIEEHGRNLRATGLPTVDPHHDDE